MAHEGVNRNLLKGGKRGKRAATIVSRVNACFRSHHAYVT